MARTQELLRGAFGRDLSQLINVYFQPKSSHPDDVGRAGIFEACSDLDADASGIAINCAALSGYIEIVRTLIYRDSWPMLFYYACRNGNRELIELVIRNTVQEPNWDIGLEGACRGGHVELITEMIERGATHFVAAFAEACAGGHMPAINTMISHGMTDLNAGLLHAYEYGQLEVAKLMAVNGASNWNQALMIACRHGSQSLIDFAIKHGADD